MKTDVCSKRCIGLFTAQCQRPPACSQGRSEVIRPLGCSGASVCKVGPFFQLLKVNKLDQVREFGVPVVKAEECLPVILALERHNETGYVRGRSSGPTVRISALHPWAGSRATYGASEVS